MDAAPAPTALTFGSEAEPEQVIEDRTITNARRKQQDLAALTTHPGWKVFVEGVERQIHALETLAEVDLKDKTYEEVGQLYLVAREASTRLKAELHKVELTANALYKKNIVK